MGRRIHALLVTSTLVATVTCREPAPPLVPTTIALSAVSVTFDALSATANVTATINDQNGALLPNAVVTWSVVGSAAGVVGTENTATITAIANGVAEVKATAGNATASVQVTVLQAEAGVRKVSGDAQAGMVGATLALDLQVAVDDRLGMAIPSQLVSFAVTEGGGSLSISAANTGVAGVAATRWTLGVSTTVPQRVTATSPGGRVVTFTAEPQAGPPVAMGLHAGNAQSAVLGAAVPVAPSVRVVDAHGNGVPLVGVTFTVVEGGGSVTGASAQTDANGIASVGSWTLGTSEGTNTLVATPTAHGFAPITYTATALPPFTPGSVVVHAGNNFAGMAGQPMSVVPAVLVRDTLGHPMPNRSVTFTVTSGGGSVTAGTVVTGADGVASAGSWVLGAIAGPNTITATVAGPGITGNGVEFRATGCAGGPGAGYEITVCFMTTMTGSERAAFESAAGRWSAAITGNLPAVTWPINQGLVGGCVGLPRPSMQIDDLLIYAIVETIDGPGGILGSAGFCIRREAGLPFIGRMRFDAADLPNLSSTLLTDLILHEMGHVLGIGTLWQDFRRDASCTPSTSGCVPSDAYFDGPNAIDGFNAVGGATYTQGNKVPIENCATGVPASCGAGTINVHWRESVLRNELMTGYLNQGGNPLSVLTIRSLQDLGYVVNPAAADAFFLTLGARAPGEIETLIHLGNDVDHFPQYTIDSAGRIRRLPQ